MKKYLIGNAHLDPVWLWRWQDGFSEIKATFQSALDRMDENKDFIFTCAGASYYKWVEENCPEMFEKIVKRVKEGRWVIVGGMWIQPDCNLPSGESFARQCLYSQRYYLEKFGIMSKVGYNVDSFGHNYMLPQILSKSGMDSYIFMRPGPYENNLGYSLFWWESPDGTKILAYRLPDPYCNWAKDKDEFINTINRSTEMITKDQLIDYMLFYGIGNHGGGPTVRQLSAIDEIIKDDKTVLYSSPNKYFSDIREQNLVLPIHTDDLQHHASGCYAAVSERKALNRKIENRLVSAEAMSVMAHMTMDFTYPKATLYQAWDNVMFNHFHDVMGGCSIREAYEDSKETDGESLAIAARVINSSAQRMSWAINTIGNDEFKVSKETDFAIWEVENRGAPIVIFNPNPFDVKSQIQAFGVSQSISDENKVMQPLQVIRASRTNGNDKYDTLFDVEIPAYGYRVYRRYKNVKHEVENIDKLIVSDLTMENDNLKISFERNTGYIKSLFDKKNNREVFKGYGFIPKIFDDYENDTWSHGVNVFDKFVGCFTDAKISVKEKGPIRACIRIESFYNKSKLTLDFYLKHDSNEIDVKVVIDWHENFKILKFGFPVDVKTNEITYEIPFGSINRPINSEEEPGLSWVDMSDEQYGLTVANNAKYSYSAKDGEMFVGAARSGIYADHFGIQNNTRDEMVYQYDHGIQEFSMVLIPHKNDLDKGKASKIAQKLNNPLIAINETYHKGVLPEINCGFSLDCENIIVSALKVSEDDKGYILRTYEANGIECECSFDLKFINKKFCVTYNKYEIKTLYIPFDGGNVEERLIIEI